MGAAKQLTFEDRAARRGIRAKRGFGSEKAFLIATIGTGGPPLDGGKSWAGGGFRLAQGGFDQRRRKNPRLESKREDTKVRS